MHGSDNRVTAVFFLCAKKSPPSDGLFINKEPLFLRFEGLFLHQNGGFLLHLIVFLEGQQI